MSFPISKISFLALALLFQGCGSTPEVGCVIPPPTLARSDRAVAIDLAARLNALPKGGNIESEFRQMTEISFGRMSDETTCLYLFLKALECYSRDGDIDESTKDRLVDVVREEWRTQCGLGERPKTFTDEERAVLSNARHGNMVYSVWRRLGNR